MLQFIEIKQSDIPFVFKGVDPSIVEPITDIHSELIMEDNSVFIFPSSNTFYSFISNNNLFDNKNKVINIEELIQGKKYENNVFLPEADTAFYDGYKVNLIHVYILNNERFYHLIRDGINKLAEFSTEQIEENTLVDVNDSEERNNL